jgi:putative nucleotidyltransferase with HDIG domain
MSLIVDKARNFVEQECKKPANRYGYEPFTAHFTPVHDYAKKLAEELGADVELVEIAAWFHDIGSIMVRREDHHITGAKIAEEKLKEWNYPLEKIEKIKHCIISHRGSQNIKRESKEAEILAEADAMTHFDMIPDLLHVAFVNEAKPRKEGIASVRQKVINSYNKLSPKAKELVKNKYDAAMLLLG